MTRPCLHSSPARWIAARGGLLVLLCAGACSSTTVPATGILEVDLGHEDPRVRIAAAEQAVAKNRLDLVPRLIENLLDDDGAVRLFTSVALRKLTGRDFDFRAHGTASEREEAMRRWEAWAKAQSAAPSSEGVSSESTSSEGTSSGGKGISSGAPASAAPGFEASASEAAAARPAGGGDSGRRGS